MGAGILPALTFKGRMKLQFEVNGQVYFLNFAEDQGKWFLLKPTATGVIAIPVYNDAATSDHFVRTGKERSNIQN